MKRKLILPTTDRLIGISAMIISLLTLIIFTYQTYFFREQSRLLVEPRLHFNTEEIENSMFVTFKQVVTNQGLGPAIICDSKITYQNKDYEVSFEELAEDKFPDYCEYYFSGEIQDINEGIYISPKDTVVLYRFTVILEKYPEFKKYLNFDTTNDKPKWDIELSYSSIFRDKKWSTNITDNKPILVK